MHEEDEVKVPTTYNLTITETQLKKILELATEANEHIEGDTGEPDDTLSTIINYFERLEGSPIHTNIVFINSYDVDQCYGGPEEGGWWYHTYACTDIRGYIGSEFVLDEFITLLQSENIDDDKMPTKEEVKAHAEKFGSYTVYDTDQYGEGRIYEISSYPACSHDTRRQHYE